MKFALLLASVLFLFSGFSQDVDTLYIEKALLGSIGNTEKLDSLEKALLPSIKKSYLLEDSYYYHLSKARFLSGQLDDAFSNAEKGIKLSKTEKNTFRAAKFHNLQASVYAYQKDYEKAIQTFKKSLKILEDSGDDYTAAQVQNNIANIFFSLSDFESAYKYSKKSHDQLSQLKDTVHLPSVMGILAVSAVKLNRVSEGKKLAKQALKLSKRYKNPIGLIVSNYSLGDVYNVEKKYDKAIEYFNQSLVLSEQYRQSHFSMLNKVGLSYAHLKAKNYQASVEMGELALVETTELKNENTLYAIHKNLGYAYDGLGQKEKAFDHMSSAHEIYIASSNTENQKAINDILIKYDTEKKEKKLIASRLENANNKNKLYKRTQVVIILGAILLLVVLSYYFYNRLQKQKMQQVKKEQESKRMMAAVLAEEKERERISNELHDGMASSITGIKLKLEDFSTSGNSTELSPLVTQLQQLHDETRRISHNLMPLGLNEENWLERLAEYCRENSSDRFKIHFMNNLRKVITLIPSESILIYRSVQELIHNVQKHAQVSSCIVQVSKLDEELIITVEDEGVGFDLGTQNGQGLGSMRQRLDKIQATIEIESKLGEGSLISISLPLT